MDTKKLSTEITGEFFEIMQTLKKTEGRLKALHEMGEAYRDELGADAGAGHEALVHLDLATEDVTNALDNLVATCGLAKPDAETAGGPFVCPNTAIHRPRRKMADLKVAA